jgi:hypothetical protein
MIKHKPNNELSDVYIYQKQVQQGLNTGIAKFVHHQEIERGCL